MGEPGESSGEIPPQLGTTPDLPVETLGGALINNKHDKCLSSESHAWGGNDVKAGVPQGSTLGSLSFVS